MRLLYMEPIRHTEYGIMDKLNSRIMPAAARRQSAEQWNNFCCVETWFASQPRKYIQLPFKVGFYLYC